MQAGECRHWYIGRRSDASTRAGSLTTEDGVVRSTASSVRAIINPRAINPLIDCGPRYRSPWPGVPPTGSVARLDIEFRRDVSPRRLLLVPHSAAAAAAAASLFKPRSHHTNPNETRVLNTSTGTFTLVCKLSATKSQIPLDGRARPDFVGDPGLRQGPLGPRESPTKSADFVWSGPVRSGPCSGVSH